MSALDLVLSRIQGPKRPAGNGWECICPVHKKGQEKDPSLHISQGRTGVVMKCFANCPTETIVEAIGLEMRDLFDDNEKTPERPRSASVRKERVTIAKLAAKFRLPVDYLAGPVVGLRERGQAVEIPYLTESGEVSFWRRRVRLAGKRKLMQPKGTSLAIYGLHRLAEFRQADHPALAMVEGESDSWVLWHSGISAIGFPGASTVSLLEEGHLEGFKSVYLFQEPGEAGEQFQLKLGARIRELGFKGAVKVVTLGEDKDPADLWLRGEKIYRERLRGALRSARNWTTESLDDYLVTLSDIERIDVEFLWPPYIPHSMVTMFAGRPGLGKSYAWCSMAVAITTGGPLPGVKAMRRGNVLIFAKEDDFHRILRPRLEDNGADLSRVKLFDLRKHHFNLERSGFELLERLIGQVRPELVVFDPIISFTGARVNLGKQNEVRGILQPLIDIAAKTGTTILLVGHLSKGSGSASALDALMGSVDFSAAPRSVLMAYPDPGAERGEETAILAHAKHNLSPRGTSLRYGVRDGRFQWLGESDLSADDLQAANGASSHDRAGVDDAVKLLREVLSGGARVNLQHLNARARKLGISSSTLGRARMQLGVATARVGIGEEAFLEVYLPSEPDAESPDPVAENHSAMLGEDDDDVPF